MDIDEALDKVGGLRRWNLAAFGLMMAAITLAGTQHLSYVFIGRSFEHHCSLPDTVTINDTLLDEKGRPRECLMYANSSEGEVTACTNGWTYEKRDADRTIVTDWDLVCSRSILADLSQSLYMVGTLIGRVLSAILADRYGRRPVNLAVFTLLVASGLALAFAPNIYWFFVLRPIIAMAETPASTVGTTYVLEQFGFRYRAFVWACLQYGWVASFLVLTPVAWYLPDWRHLQLAISILCVVGLLTIWVPESPMWLVANGGREEAEQQLQRMARYNGIKVNGRILFEVADKSNYEKEKGTEDPESADSLVPNGHKCPTPMVVSDEQTPRDPTDPDVPIGSETVLDLFRWPLLRKYTIITMMLWLSNNLVYFFLVLSVPTLGGNVYLNFVLNGLVEIPSIIIGTVALKKSRRISEFVFKIIAAVTLVTVAFVPAKTASGKDLTSVIITLAMLGKFAIAAAYSMLILYSREYFPTNLRATSDGICNVLGGLGMVIAPFASYAARSKPWVPNLILGLFSLVMAMSTILLPETKDWPLPQSVADVYRFTRGDHHARKHTNMESVIGCAPIEEVDSVAELKT